jgi:hypothetical protein
MALTIRSQGGKARRSFIFEQDLPFCTDRLFDRHRGRIPTYSSPSSATRFTAGAGDLL